jgi:putative NIF3 family GTP cyclohydrolase 1 type 2
MLKHHPYEEPAYDIIQLSNEWSAVGSGLMGELPAPLTPPAFLQLLKDQFQLSVIRHTIPPAQAIHKVAICGGAGSFLTKTALAAGAHAFVTGDVKYHEFFDAEKRLLLADIGHWESEQFTIDLQNCCENESCRVFQMNRNTNVQVSDTTSDEQGPNAGTKNKKLQTQIWLLQKSIL